MNLSRKFLAGAIIALLPLSGALACTTTAWTAVAGTPVAEDPLVNNANNNSPDTADVKRYSAQCGLLADAVGDFVTNDTPLTEGIFRMRVYLYPSVTAGTPVVYRATAADGGTGAEIFSIAYDAAADEFDFAAVGTTVPSATGIVPDRWYSVEILHQNGQTLSVSVAGNNSGVANGPTQTLTSAGNVAGTVGSAQLGFISGAGVTGVIQADEYDSTRSAATPIGRLRRGDANGSCKTTPTTLSVADAVIIRNEALTASGPTPALAAGEPDTNENGAVTPADAALVRNMVLTGQNSCL